MRRLRDVVANKPDALCGSQPFYIVMQTDGSEGAALALLGAELKARAFISIM